MSTSTEKPQENIDIDTLLTGLLLLATSNQQKDLLIAAFSKILLTVTGHTDEIARSIRRHQSTPLEVRSNPQSLLGKILGQTEEIEKGIIEKLEQMFDEHEELLTQVLKPGEKGDDIKN